KLDSYHDEAHQEYDLKLDGDPNFPGPSFRRDLDAKLERYQKELEHDPKSILSGVTADEEDLKRRRDHISDERKYTDLPPALRKSEVQRTQSYIDRLESLRQRALGTTHAAPSETSDPLQQQIATQRPFADGARAQAQTAFDDARYCRYIFHANPMGIG